MIADTEVEGALKYMASTDESCAKAKARVKALGVIVVFFLCGGLCGDKSLVRVSFGGGYEILQRL